MNTIWDTELSDVSPTAKLVYVWSFTNPACGMAGVYPMPTKKVAASLDLERQDAQDAIGELVMHELLWHDNVWLWVPARVKHLHTRTKQIASSIAKDLSVVPDGHKILELFDRRYGDSWISEYVDLNLKRGSAEVQVRFSRGSESPIDKPGVEPHPNLTRTSPEVPLDVAVAADDERELATSLSSIRSSSLPVLQPVVAREPLDVLLDDLRKLWPPARNFASDRNRQEEALLTQRDDLPDNLVDLARLYVEAHNFATDPTGCPNLSKWIADRRWEAPFPAKKKSKVDDSEDFIAQKLREAGLA